MRFTFLLSIFKRVGCHLASEIFSNQFRRIFSALLSTLIHRIVTAMQSCSHAVLFPVCYAYFIPIYSLSTVAIPFIMMNMSRNCIVFICKQKKLLHGQSAHCWYTKYICISYVYRSVKEMFLALIVPTLPWIQKRVLRLYGMKFCSLKRGRKSMNSKTNR